MLKRLVKKLKDNVHKRASFARDENGNIMILTALMTPILMMAVTTAIDMGELHRAKSNFQTAVDAATLAFAREFGKSENDTGNGNSVKKRYDAALPIARAVFQANLENLPDSQGTIDFEVGEGDCNADGVTSVAQLNHDVFFPAFHKLRNANLEGDKVGIKGGATVRCNNSTFEIALVLDNSGSMGSNNKMGTLRSSAITLVNRMFNGMKDRLEAEPLGFSVVPFAATVNVGTDNRDADWMDTTGASPIHHENLDWDNNPLAIKNGDIYQTITGQPLTRFSLYDALPGHSWQGCVEALPYPHLVENNEPTDADPSTLIVPTFAPDTPDNWTNEFDVVAVQEDKAICTNWQSRTYRYRGRTYTRTQRRCTRWSDGLRAQRHPQNYAYRPSRNDRIEYRNGNYISSEETVNTLRNDDRIQEKTYPRNNYVRDDHNFPYATMVHPRLKTYTGTGPDQHKRQKWSWKYFNDPFGNNGLHRYPSGSPNDACTTQAILPLTNDKNDIVRDLAQMSASGATNIQQGMSWGWKTLTETEPFAGARAAETSGNRKIMIVMSDGNNTYYPSTLWDANAADMNKSFYGAWGHSANGRLFDNFDAIANPDHDFNTFRMAMDEHLAETCLNVKRDNITIYTIAFDVPNGSSVETLLRNCASEDLGGSKLYIKAKNNADLKDAFDSIYESLSELRISN